MEHSHRYQHFALDINGNLVDIRHTAAMDEKIYFCPHCHQEMITKRGNVRQWHFAHKANKCSYDRYLHSIAEIMIMDWFNEKESVVLVMNTLEKCSMYDDCKFHYNDDCRRSSTTQYDLKKYYSKCEREQGFGGFVADLLCENINNSNAPIFIEILVTHECSQEKKNSGMRIIEFVIQSEEDILNIVHSSQIREGNNVRLYNFKRKDVPVNDMELSFQKYVLYPTMKSYVNRHSCTCRNYNQHRKGIYEISMPYDNCIPYFINSGGFYTVGKARAYIDGYLKKDCQLCKWQATDYMGDSFCKLYKKCGNPKYCNDNDASQCSMFRENREVIDFAISDFNEYAKETFVDIWKKEVSKL